VKKAIATLSHCQPHCATIHSATASHTAQPYTQPLPATLRNHTLSHCQPHCATTHSATASHTAQPYAMVNTVYTVRSGKVALPPLDPLSNGPFGPSPDRTPPLNQRLGTAPEPASHVLRTGLTRVATGVSGSSVTAAGSVRLSCACACVCASPGIMYHQNNPLSGKCAVAAPNPPIVVPLGRARIHHQVDSFPRRLLTL
jgi:hypothetical protein